MFYVLPVNCEQLQVLSCLWTLIRPPSFLMSMTCMMCWTKCQMRLLIY